MIPQIIHQTWKTTNLPENFKKFHIKIKRLHPEWVVRLWTDEDNLQLVRQYFPHLLNSYEALEYNIMRADIIRYMYMYQFGGYYLDLDYEVLAPFDKETSESDLLLPISNTRNGSVILGNSIFGSIPSHIFWKDVLDDFQKNPPIKRFFNKFEVLKFTGPDFISKIYFKNPQKYNGHLVPKSIYHPDNTLINQPNYRRNLREIGTRGIHHCQGSWLKENNSIMNIVSRANSSVKRRFSSLIK
jgi:mannosyltransferase OCH1-like enzyme